MSGRLAVWKTAGQMEEGFLNPTEQVPGLTNWPLVVHVHPQQDSSRRSGKVGAEGAAATTGDGAVC